MKPFVSLKEYVLPFLLGIVPIVSWANATTSKYAEIHWTFSPSGSSELFPVRLGSVLDFQIPGNAPCCTGAYMAEIRLKDVWMESFQAPSLEGLGIYFPPLGGLRRIVINGRNFDLPAADYSSVGPIVPVSGLADISDSVSIRLEIEGSRSPYVGGWTGDLEFGSIPHLIQSRDKWLVHQVIFPLINAGFFLCVFLLFCFLRFSKNINEPLLNAYLFLTLSWSVEFIFLSGIVRVWSMSLGTYFHLPVFHLASIGLAGVIGIYSEVSNKVLKGIKFGLILLLGLSLVTCSVAAWDIAALLMVATSVPMIYLAFLVSKKTETIMDVLFSLLVWSVCIGLVNDSIKYCFKEMGYWDPLPYVVRYTSLPILFMSIVHIAQRLTLAIYEASKRSVFDDIALRVEHDLKSPIALLGVAAKSGLGSPAEIQDLIRIGTTRILEVCRALTGSDVPQVIEGAVFLNSLEEGIKEKIIEWSDRSEVSIKFEGFQESVNFKVRLSLSEFRRIISNLINNSVESIETSGTVFVRLNVTPVSIQIVVSDSGKGIDAKRLALLGATGATFGKENGRGFGLRSAHEVLRMWNSKLSVESTLNRGTKITISLPLYFHRFSASD